MVTPLHFHVLLPDVGITQYDKIQYKLYFLHFRRECTDYWIRLFRRLSDELYFDGTFIDVSLIQFCFMHLIQVLLKM